MDAFVVDSIICIDDDVGFFAVTVNVAVFVVDDDDDDDDDYEDEEPQDGSLLTSQVARNHFFPILISELVKERILDNK